MAGQNPEAWLTARRAAGKPDERWEQIPGWPHEVSDQGRVRTAKGKILTQRPNGRPEGSPPELQYRLVDLYANKNKWTVAVHVLVLTVFEGLKSAGQQCRHLYGNPAHNWWPEGITWGDAIEQAIDKVLDPRWDTPEAKARRSEGARRAAATREPGTVLGQARAYLLEALTDGPRLLTELQDGAAARGISRKVLHVARRDLGAPWMVSLNVTAEEEAQSQLQAVAEPDEVEKETPRLEQNTTSYGTPVAQSDVTVEAERRRRWPSLPGDEQPCVVCTEGELWSGYLRRSMRCPVCSGTGLRRVAG